MVPCYNQLRATRYRPSYPLGYCLCCDRPLEARARLNKLFCQASCRAFVWSRANREFSSTITVADFENVRESIKQFAARMNRVVVGTRWSVGIRSPKADRQIGYSTFPPNVETPSACLMRRAGRALAVPPRTASARGSGPRVPVVGSFR